jgi:hypothetical protein
MLADHGRTSGRLLVLIDYRDRLGVCPPGRGSPDGRRTGQAITFLFRLWGFNSASSSMTWAGTARSR